MKQHPNSRRKPITTPECGSGDYLLQKQANSLKAFVSQQRGRSQQSNSKTAWLVDWEQLAAEGELANKQLQQALQPAGAAAPSTSSNSSLSTCAELQHEFACLSAQHQELEAATQEQQLQLLGQVQDLCALVRRAVQLGLTATPSDVSNLVLTPQEAAALDSLLQELRWLQQDTRQQGQELAASAQALICELAAAAPAGSCGASAGMLDAILIRKESGRLASACSDGDAVFEPAAAETQVTGVGGAVMCACSSHASSSSSSTEPSCASSTAAAAAGTLHSGDADLELQQLLRQHPLVPGVGNTLHQQLLESYSTLQHQHQQQLQNISAQLRQHATRCSGWSADDHALFVWLRAQALQQSAASAGGAVHSTSASSSCIISSRKCGGGRSGSSSSSGGSGSAAGKSAALVSYLAVRMPGKTKQQLEAHEAWFGTAMLYQRRAEDMREGWQRQRSAFMTEAAASLANASASTTAAAEAAANRLSTALSRQLLHDHLEGMAVIRREQQELVSAQAAAAEAAEAAKAAEEAAAHQERRAGQREMVLQHKQQIAAQQLEQEALTEEARRAAVAASAAAIEASRPVVAARQADALQRLQQQHEQLRQRASDAEARQQRLAAIAAALGPKLQRDPDRVLQPTAASAAEATAVGAAFRPVHGFTAQQVTADPRFRLVEALRAAGALRGGAGSAGYIKQAMARLQ